MAANTSTLDPLMKDDYGVGLKNQMNDELPLLGMFERVDDVQWQGRTHIEPIHIDRNRGAYATAEGGAPPQAGFQQIENLRIPIRYMHGAIQLTAQVIKATRNNKGAFARAMRLEMDRLLVDLRTLRQFYLWGDGRAIRAKVDTGSSGVVLELDSPYGIQGENNNGSRFLNVGDWITTIVPETGALRNTVSRQVVAVNAGTAADVTLNAALATSTETDWVVKCHGSDATLSLEDTEFNHAPMGLLGMIDDGTYLSNYFGLSRTTFETLQSYVVATAGALSADLIMRGVDVSAQRGNGRVDCHLMHPSVRRAYLSIMENDRRYTQSALKSPDAGTVAGKTYDEGIKFGGVPIVIDHYAPYGFWFGLDKSGLRRFVMTDGEWADETGAIWTEVSGSVDTYKAVYRIYENFCNLYPNRSFRFDGITANLVNIHVA